MQYQININQKKLAESKLDLADAAILEYLYHLCSSVSQKVENQRLVDDYGVWTWIDFKQLSKEMPLLRIKDGGAISRRFKTIESEKYILTKKGAGNRMYVKLTSKCDGLYKDVPNDEDEPELTDNKTGTNRHKKSTPELTTVKTGTNQSTPELTDNNSRIDNRQDSPHTPLKEYIINNSSTRDSKEKESKEKESSDIAISSQALTPSNDHAKYCCLEDLQPSDLEYISTFYQVPLSFVASKLDDMTNWHEMRPRKNRYDNYRRALMDWVKRDAVKIHDQERRAYGSSRREVIR